MHSLHRFVRDPLCHFTVIGALLFTINTYFQRDTPAEDEIRVTEQRIAHLANVFERGWLRPPDTGELEELIDNFVREEVLYREAIRIGLDKDDTVIRRRLRMKMEFLARDLVDAIAPGDPVLQNYYSVNSERYTLPTRYSFRQIYFNSDKRPEVAEDTRLVLAKITAGADPQKLGDNNLLQHEYTNVTADGADKAFGSSFSLQLAELETGQWTGPVTSAYGEHLVLVTDHQPALLAPFEQVRDEVLRDWQKEQQDRILETQYQTLLQLYDVQIATPPPAILAPDSGAQNGADEVAHQ